MIEGIWLDGQTFAVVRARVRGTRLDQLIGKTGPIPIGRVATTIQTVHDAIAWARDNGVVNRRVALSSVMFQQGNERVFLTLELAAFVRGAIPDECDDARTIGVLASDMMLGRITRAGVPALAVSIPPHLITAVSRSVMAIRRCHAGNAKQVVASLLSALHSAAAGEPAPAESVTAWAEVAPVEPVGAAFEPAALRRVVAGASRNRATSRQSQQTRQRLKSSFNPRTPRARLHRPSRGGRVAVRIQRAPRNRGRAAAIIAVLTVLSFEASRERAQRPRIGGTERSARAQAAGDVSPPPATRNGAGCYATARRRARVVSQIGKRIGQPRVPVAGRRRSAHVSHSRDRTKRSRHERGVRKAHTRTATSVERGRCRPRSRVCRQTPAIATKVVGRPRCGVSQGWNSPVVRARAIVVFRAAVSQSRARTSENARRRSARTLVERSTISAFAR